MVKRHRAMADLRSTGLPTREPAGTRRAGHDSGRHAGTAVGEALAKAADQWRRRCLRVVPSVKIRELVKFRSGSRQATGVYTSVFIFAMNQKNTIRCQPISRK